MIFLASVGMLVWLNVPNPALPPQDPARLLGDWWFIYGFTYFGILLTGIAALMLADGYRRETATRWLVIPYLFIGIIPLSIYLALRPEDEDGIEPRWLARAFRAPRFWWVLCALVFVCAVAMLPFGSFGHLLQTMRHNYGWWFMAFDIVLNQLLCLPLLSAHMQHRSVGNQSVWLALVAVTGPIGLCAYLARQR
jgi:hypothetical protein